MAPDEYKSTGELITALYERYYNKMYGISLSILKDRYLAEDAVHDSMMKIIKKTEAIKDIESVECINYIQIVVKHTAIDFYRKRKKEENNLSYGIDYSWLNTKADEETLDLLEKENCFSETILDVLKNLKQRDKDIIILFYVNGCSTKEIAEIIGIKNQSVKMRLSRARKKIAKALEREEAKK